MINRIRDAAAIATVLAIALPAQAIELKVVRGGNAGGVASTLILGEDDVILVDAQFVRSDAHRVVAEILDSGRSLTAVWITHAHPDHFLGTEVIVAAFPDAVVYARPAVIEQLTQSTPAMIERLIGRLGANTPQAPVFPTAYTDAALVLEGAELPILDGLSGDTEPHAAIHVPELKALIAGDIVFNGMHAWTASNTPETRVEWLSTIEKLEAMDLDIIVAGHQIPDGPDRPAALAETAAYLVAFDTALSEASSAEELTAMMVEAHPDLEGRFVLQRGAQAAFSE